MSTLPAVPSLEQLKKQAKDLRKAAASGDAAALARIRAVPELKDHDGKGLTAAHAQLVLAREYGFESWPKLKHHVERARLQAGDPAAAFFEAVLTTSAGNNFELDFARATAALASNPDYARANLYAACATGEREAAEAFLAQDPSLAKAKGGPKHREPLLYLAFSRFLRHDARRAEAMLTLARRLLDLGASPNAFYPSENEGYRDEPQAALYGAAGLNDHAGLTRMLLEAGADPNDHESLYHACESSDLSCLRLILEAKPKKEWASYCLAHKLDYEDYEGAKLFLDHGADPNHVTPHGERGTRLHHALTRRRGARIVELLLERGADPNIKDGQGCTGYALAVRTGREDLAALLRRHGAREDVLREVDRFLGACWQAREADARASLAREPGLLGAMKPEDHELMVGAAWEGNLPALRTMLAVGFDPARTGTHGQTALHAACFKGEAEIVRLLLTYKPDLERKDPHYSGTPLGWALAGTWKVLERNPRGDYPAVVDALLTAGAALPEQPKGSDDVLAVLRAHAERRKA
ncbi:MAG: ankyrin repeat domain-containing protein [Planctomycetota bacterium]|nr:ankyrin repeat domain-containing protein [Planctomycetota bacterium]